MKTHTTFHVWDCVSGVSRSLAHSGTMDGGYLGHERGSAPKRGEHTKPTPLSLPSSVSDQREPNCPRDSVSPGSFILAKRGHFKV